MQGNPIERYPVSEKSAVAIPVGIAQDQLDELSINTIRALAIDAVEKAKEKASRPEHSRLHSRQDRHAERHDCAIGLRPSQDEATDRVFDSVQRCGWQAGQCASRRR